MAHQKRKESSILLMLTFFTSSNNMISHNNIYFMRYYTITFQIWVNQFLNDKNGGKNMAFKFTDGNFNKEALEADKPVLVDFYADWCGPCKMMSPIIEELAKDYEGEIIIGKLNTDENPNTTAQYKVMSIPTMILFKDGKELDKVVGAVSKDTLVEKLDAQK